jgi:hypothetical protein
VFVCYRWHELERVAEVVEVLVSSNPSGPTTRPLNLLDLWRVRSDGKAQVMVVEEISSLRYCVSEYSECISTRPIVTH